MRMGRGETTIVESVALGSGRRSAQSEKILSGGYRDCACPDLEVGELIELPNGMLEIRSGDDAALLRGLAQIDGALIDHRGRVEVLLSGERKALVDIEAARLTTPGEMSEGEIRALWMAALAQRSGLDGSNLDLADGWDYYRELRDPSSARALALLARELDDVSLTITESPDTDDNSTAIIPPRTAARRRLKELFDRTGEIVRDASSPSEDLAAMLFGVRDGQISYDLEQVERFRLADEKMSSGGMSLIPESKVRMKRDEDGNAVLDENGHKISDGEYEMLPENSEIMQRIIDHFSMGYRFVTITSRPGAGKGALWRELAAAHKAPLTTINLSASASLVELTGGDGIETVEIKDENGNTIGVAPRTVQQLGPIGAAVSNPGFVELQEVAGLAAEMIVLNSTVGDGSDPEERYLAISASAPPKSGKQRVSSEKVKAELESVKGGSKKLRDELSGALGDEKTDARELKQIISRNAGEGDEVLRDAVLNAIEDETAERPQRLLLPVDKDCHIMASWNPGRADAHLEQSTEERALNLRMSRPSINDDARRWARMATHDLNAQTMVEGARREYSAEDLLPTVRLIRALQDHHANNPNDQPREPEVRQGVKFFDTMMMRAHRGSYSAATIALEQLTYLLPSEENFRHHARSAGDDSVTVSSSMVQFLQSVAKEEMLALINQVKDIASEYSEE